MREVLKDEDGSLLPEQYAFVIFHRLRPAFGNIDNCKETRSKNGKKKI